MNKLTLISFLLVLTACSTPQVEAMKFKNPGPSGLSILNIDKTEHVEAYRIAEQHCAKYSKVTRLSKKFKQRNESDLPLTTMVFQCLRPSS